MRVFFNANKNLFFFFCSDMFTKVKLNSSETKKRQKIVAWQQVALRCFVVALWTTNIYFWYLKPSEYYCDEGSGFNNLDLLATFPVYARCSKRYSKFISLGPYSLFFLVTWLLKKMCLCDWFYMSCDCILLLHLVLLLPLKGYLCHYFCFVSSFLRPN